MKTLIVIFSLLIVGIRGASQFIQEQNALPVQIAGRIEQGTPKDTFQIILWKEYIYHLVGAEIFNLPLDDSGRFTITLPAIRHITRIVFQKAGTEFANLGNFPVAPGDNISIRVFKQEDDYQVLFSGKGALKYTLHASYLLEKERFSEERKNLKEGNHPEVGLQQIIAFSNASKKRLLDQLNSNKMLLGKEAYVFLSAEYAAYFDFITQRETMDRYIKCKDDNCRLSFQSQLQNYSKRVKDNGDSIRSFSWDYVLSLINGEQTRLSMLKGGSGYGFAELFSALVNNYGGLLREKLLMTLMSDPSMKAEANDNRQETFDSCLQQAYTLTRTPFIKNEIGQLIGVFSKGKPAFPFQFEDEKGRLVKLEDFKGKVVLLHMWFTSCSGCIQFTQKMKESVLPALKSYPNLTVISICTDEDKQQWLKSLARGIYTGKEDINLYTGGLSFYDIAMVKHYQIQGMPFILLIDEAGRISAQFSNRQAEKDIIATIKTTLEQSAKNLAGN